MHVQVRLMENFGQNVGVPWLSDTEGALCFICKEVRIMSVTFSHTIIFNCDMFEHTVTDSIVSYLTAVELDLSYNYTMRFIGYDSIQTH